MEAPDHKAPKAEFRDGDEVMDKSRFGEVLEDIGISSKKEETEARPRPKKKAAKPSRKKPARPEKKRKPKPSIDFDDDDRSDETAIEDDPRMLDEPQTLDESAPRILGEPSMPSDEDLARPSSNYVDEDDEEDEDANYVPPYSLVAQLLQEDNIVGKERRGKPLVEVLTLQGDTVSAANLLRPGDSFWVGPEIGILRRRRARDLPPRVRLLKYKRGGECQVEMHKQVTGTLKRGQQRIKLDSVSGMEKDRRRGTMMMGFKTGEILDIVDAGSRYHIRFVSPPPPVQDGRGVIERIRPDKSILRAFGGSLGAHIVALILVYLLVPPEIVHSTLRKNDEFVEVIMDAAPDIEEEKPPEEEPEEEEPQKAEDEKAPPKQNKSKRKSRSGGTTKAPAGVLGLLSKKGSSKAPGPAAAVAAVSNLTAARVPGAASGYRVSGLIGKLPSNSLSVGGGGGGLMTKGGAALLRGGGGGGGLARGKKRGVGGLVQKNPKAMRSVGQGHLDRDEIQKVINKHIGQIQRCYERELLRTPGLSGKVQVEWTIATSGKVRSARQTYTSIRSNGVSNCILGAIRSWVFPRPKGGEVIVNYPFIFKSIGF
jgi:outer membrane biosynthesis protein TonB